MKKIILSLILVLILFGISESRCSNTYCTRIAISGTGGSVGDADKLVCTGSECITKDPLIIFDNENDWVTFFEYDSTSTSSELYPGYGASVIKPDDTTTGRWLQISSKCNQLGRRYLSCYSNLAAAISDIGATVTTLVIDTTETLAATTTIASTTDVEQICGAVITTDSNTFNINGSYKAPNCQTFSGTGVAFGSEKTVNLTWFGPNADGATTDTAIIQAAITATPAGGTVHIYKTTNSYFIASQITTKTGVNIQGHGFPILEADGTTFDYNVFLTSNTSDFFIDGISFYSGIGQNASGFYIHAGANTDRMVVSNFICNGGMSCVKIDESTSSDIRIFNGTISNMTATQGGAILSHAVGTYIDNVRFDTIGTASTEQAIYIGTGGSSTTSTVSNIYGKTLDGYLVSSDGDHLTVTNAIAENCYGGFSGQMNCTNCIVKNQDTAGGTAFFMGDYSEVSNSRVDGYVGIALKLNNYTKINNTLVEASASTTTSSTLVQWSGTNSELDNVTFIGTSVAAQTPTTGMAIGSGKNHSIVNDCKFYNAATGTVISIAGSDVNVTNNYFDSTDAAVFHDKLVAFSANATDFDIHGNRSNYDTGTPTDEYDTETNISDANANNGFLYDNYSILAGTNFPTAASAATVRLDSSSNQGIISGSTEIHYILGTVRKVGNIITLYFSGSLTLANDTATGNLSLPGDINVVTGSIVSLIFDGSNWLLVEKYKASSHETLTASGAITSGVENVYLDHTTVTIAATIASSKNHFGLFNVMALTEPGAGQDHTVTLTSGTWNGSNTIATFADINDALLVYFDQTGKGTIVINTGGVALSGP